MPAFGVQRYNIPDAARLAQAEQEKYDLRGLGQLAGGAMGKRDTDIKYRRAMGLQDDRTTLGEGVGKAWDWMKDKGQDVLDLVAPVATEFKESGAQLMKPLVDWAEPKLDRVNDEIEYFQDPFHATDKRTAEYEDAQGKAKWEDTGLPAPEGMEDTQAPTPMIGSELPVPPELASENLVQGAPAGGTSGLAAAKAESMPPPLTEETPKVPDNVIAPGDKDWSNLYSIDPERAKFDWSREVDKMQTSRSREAQRAYNVEHDAPIRKEMEAKAIQLHKDLKNGVIKKDSDTYADRRGEIAQLAADLRVPYAKNAFEKLLSEGIVDRTLDLREDKEEQRIMEKKATAAADAGKEIMKGYRETLNKIETRGTMLESFRQGTLDAIRTKSGAAFSGALKSLIQSLDNSVVMAKEWGPFQNASYLDRAKSWLESQTNNTVFSGEEMRQAWETAKAWALSTNTSVDNAIQSADKQAAAYPGLAKLGVSAEEVSGYLKESLGAYRSFSDFSVEPEWPKVLDMNSPVANDLKGDVDKAGGVPNPFERPTAKITEGDDVREATPEDL